MTWQVLLPRLIDDAGPESISDIATFTSLADYEDREALLDDVDRFDAIIARLIEVDAELIARADNLKVVSKHGVGLDNVDIDAATERGIVVCNTPGANAQSVAEHTMMLVLTVRKHGLVADADLRRGEWNREQYLGHRLQGNTYGVFGCGDIGSRVATLARAFGMSVVAYDPYLDGDDFPEGVDEVATKADLFEAADIVSVHAPHTEETHHAVSTEELGLLSESGILVNTARGGLVDEAALIDALEAAIIGGAGLDVFEQEPPSADNPLFDLDSVVVTPHIAGSTIESNREKAVRAAENVRTVYEGGVPESAANADDL